MNMTLSRGAAALYCAMALALMSCASDGSGKKGSGPAGETTTVSVRIDFPADDQMQAHLAALGTADSQALGTFADVASVSVAVSDGETQLTAEALTKDPETGIWSGTISGLPIGPLLTFTVSAMNGDTPPVEIFSGSESRALSGADVIDVRLDPVPGAPILIPRIVSIVVADPILEGSSTDVFFELQGSPEETLTVTVTPVPGGGTFDPSSAELALASSGSGTLRVTYTAPENEEALYTHNVSVVNSQDNSVSASFETNVVLESTNITVSLQFNPVVTAISGERSTDTVTWTASVEDDGPAEELAYLWSFDQVAGAGSVSFDPGDSSSAVMLNYEETVSGEISLALTDLDGLGGTTTVTLTLPAGQFPDDLQHTPGELTIDAFDRGWWRDEGAHTASNQDTFTGGCCGPQVHRSYFQFDLDEVPAGQTVVGAVLQLEVAICVNCDAEEDLTIWDVTTDSVTLDSDAVDNVAVFDDLGSGLSYGAFSVSDASVDTILSIPLNSQAVSDINAKLGSPFAVGLNVDTLREPLSGDEGVSFGGSETRLHQLVLTLR